MKRLFRLFKGLLLVISLSAVLNWVALAVLILMIVLNVPKVLWIIAALLFWFENQLIAVQFNIERNEAEEAMWTEVDEEKLQEYMRKLDEMKEKVG